MFIHHEWIGDCQVGDDLVFTVEANKDGMPQARDVVGADGRPVERQPRSGAKGQQKGGGGGDGNKKKKKGPVEDPGKSKKKPDADMEPSLPLMDRTTVMLRGIPHEVSRSDFVSMLDAKGFDLQYDFVYLPTSFRTWKSMGYAFVNLTAPEHARQLMETFQGFDGWEAAGMLNAGKRKTEGVTPIKQVDMHWSTLQGIDDHIERYRNSPVMHPDVPDKYRPLLLKDGIAMAFPAPTKELREPRLRAKERPGAPDADAADAAKKDEADAQVDYGFEQDEDDGEYFKNKDDDDASG